jgi:nucleotide-binding universal stress UspA family protein
VVSESPAHIAVFKSKAPLPTSFRKILLPTKGDALFPAVFEFVALFAESVKDASLTVLYADAARTVPARWSPLSILLGADAPPAESLDERSRMTRLIHEAIEEHAATAAQELRVEFNTITGPDTARIIIQEASTGGYDLIVLGALKHLMRERLFFGRTVDEIAKRAPCPVIVFTPKREAIERSGEH